VTADGDQQGNSVKRVLIKRPDGTVQELSGAEAEKVIVRDGGIDRAATEAEAGDRRIMVRKLEGDADHKEVRHNELFRLTLGLLLSAPQGLDVNYNYGGDADVDGTPCSIVVAETAGTSYKIYLNRTSYLPVMMVYTGMRMPNVMFLKRDGVPPADAKDKMVFLRSVDAPAEQTAEFQVKFSDYRTVSGVQFPFKWVQTAGGAADETFEVSSFEVNPANIAEQFEKPRGAVFRTTKPE
jgi:hypothetical protein